MTHRTHPGSGAVVVGNIAVAIALIVLTALLAGCDFASFGPHLTSSSCGTACVIPGYITPYSVWMLRGDTVRFNVCNSYELCGQANDTGNVAAQWSVPDSSVVAISHGSPALTVGSVTSVLVRAIAPGRATLSVTFPQGGYQNPIITVVDSSAITSIELPYVYTTSFGPYTDTLRVNGQATFDVHLKDVNGIFYRGRPTAYAVTDTTVLKVVAQTSTYDRVAQMHIYALKPGKAALQVTFLGVTATRQVVVVP